MNVRGIVVFRHNSILVINVITKLSPVILPQRGEITKPNGKRGSAPPWVSDVEFVCTLTGVQLFRPLTHDSFNCTALRCGFSVVAVPSAARLSGACTGLED